jgi:hypothetical protein
LRRFGLNPDGSIAEEDPGNQQSQSSTPQELGCLRNALVLEQAGTGADDSAGAQVPAEIALFLAKP